jgi:hypothetical protein
MGAAAAPTWAQSHLLPDSPALSRCAPQVLIITPIARCFDTANKNNTEASSPSPTGCRANRRLLETLDKNAVRAWLR